ncbi:MAG: hypothetical protein HKP27_14600, partial [Myxococcales bacterium]|nr:hypothetical protein [Myxococcales bacterium]
MIKASWTDAAEDRLKRSALFHLLSGVAPDVLTTLGVAVSLLGAWAFAVGSFAAGGLLILAGG